MEGIATPEELRRLHKRARTHYRATQALFLKHNRQVNGPALTVISNGSDVPPATTLPGIEGLTLRSTSFAATAIEDIQNAPTWEFLLGSPDYCDCDQCSSVTSPAAYMVDLLLWLQRAPGGTPTPYDVLMQRRPDLKKILLNCQNTETLVPYIDLVCELLEEETAIRADLRAHPGAPTLTATILAEWRRKRQTTLSEQEISSLSRAHRPLGVYRCFISVYRCHGAAI